MPPDQKSRARDKDKPQDITHVLEEHAIASFCK